MAEEKRRILAGMHKDLMVNIIMGESEKVSFSVDYENRAVTFTGKDRLDIVILLQMMSHTHDLIISDIEKEESA